MKIIFLFSLLIASVAFAQNSPQDAAHVSLSLQVLRLDLEVFMPVAPLMPAVTEAVVQRLNGD